MKHASKKLLESVISTLHNILDEGAGILALTDDVISVVNAVIMPNAEGYYIVTARSGDQVDGFAVSRKPGRGYSDLTAHSGLLEGLRVKDLIE